MCDYPHFLLASPVWALQDAGHNYRLDTRVGAAASLLSGSSRKKGGQLGTTFELLALCFDRAVDSGGWAAQLAVGGRRYWQCPALLLSSDETWKCRSS